jgi:hypothetical protein
MLYSNSVIIFRYLCVGNLMIALIFRALGQRVIFLEPVGFLRDTVWMHQFSRLGLEWVNYNTYAGYIANSNLVYAAKYANELGEKIFSKTEVERFSKEVTGLDGDLQKTNAVIYDYLVNLLLDSSRAYALAEYFREQGMSANIYQKRTFTDFLLIKFRITKVRNYYPRFGISFLSQVLRYSFLRKIFFTVLNRLSSKLNQLNKINRLNKQEKTIDESTISIVLEKSASVIFFPHKGLSYASLYDKDLYYSTDSDSPYHPENVQHIELADMMSVQERVSVEKSYEERNIKVTFIEFDKQSIIQKVSTVFKKFFSGRWTFLAFAKALILSQIELRIVSYRQSFLNLANAQVALLGYDTLFPLPAAIALQSYGIKVVAIQERFVSAFYPFHTLILDYYYVHGTIIKQTLEKNPKYSISNIIVTGDPRAIKIADYQKKSQTKVNEDFKEYSKVCLVLDYHSVKDPFSNAFLNGCDWESNLFFYAIIARLAEENSDCAFVIRGKNSDWHNISSMNPAKQNFDTIENVFLDDCYDKFDRSYELAGMANVVIARYTSLCDQCLANGIPTLIFEGTPNQSNKISHWHDYKPFPIMIHTEQELQLRFVQIMNDDIFLPKKEFETMHDNYYNYKVGDGGKPTSLKFIRDMLENLLKPIL